jgi:hypothetical protein
MRIRCAARREVLFRAVRGALVMERELAGLQRDLHRAALVGDPQRSSARQHVVGSVGLLMRQVWTEMGAWQHLQGAVLRRGLGEGDPGGNLLVRLEPEICVVLVPGDVRTILAPLAKIEAPNTMMSGPIKSSTASSMNGLRASSTTHSIARWPLIFMLRLAAAFSASNARIGASQPRSRK